MYSTIIDTNGNNIGDTADEVMSESWFDGAGRVRRSRTPHTFDENGNPINWAGTIVEYDILGRPKRQSVPTEISVPDVNNPDTGAPAGDDLTRGFLWTYQKYDWKGRVVRKINTDGVDSPTVNDSDFLVAYEGCCCAGGLVTTIEGENIVESDYQGQNPTTLGRRKQKVYEDILGRTSRTEVLNWNGTVYSTNTVQFNGRDQAASVTQTEASTSVSQITSMTYDGHGRLKTQHRPEQTAGTFATYNYNLDDSIQSAVDARGAATNYLYNSRRLVEQINYTSPEATLIPMTPTANFTYDNIGNRITMTDGLGNAAYAYNELSQMTSETRRFALPLWGW